MPSQASSLARPAFWSLPDAGISGLSFKFQFYSWRLFEARRGYLDQTLRWAQDEFQENREKRIFLWL